LGQELGSGVQFVTVVGFFIARWIGQELTAKFCRFAIQSPIRTTKPALPLKSVSPRRGQGSSRRLG
jgi:hypothetical protein